MVLSLVQLERGVTSELVFEAGDRVLEPRSGSDGRDAAVRRFQTTMDSAGSASTASAAVNGWARTGAGQHIRLRTSVSWLA